MGRTGGPWVRALVLVLLAMGLLGCGLVRHSDPLAELPTIVGGEQMQYLFQHGHDAPDWAREILATTGHPEADLTTTVSFTSPGPHEYQSYVVRVAGVDGRTLVDPIIHAFFDGDNIWTEVIGGKTVTRYSYPEATAADNPIYVYAYDDVVVSILSRRPNEAEEALRQMPTVRKTVAKSGSHGTATSRSQVTRSGRLSNR